MIAKSPYFKGLFDFNPTQEEIEIHDFSYEAISALVEYFYTGRSSFDSAILIEMFQVS